MTDDFRSDRMPSPEGKGIVRKAWDAYAAAVNKATAPPVEAALSLGDGPLKLQTLKLPRAIVPKQRQ